MIPESKEEQLEEVASIVKPEPSYKLIWNDEKVKFHIEPRFGIVESFQDKLAYVKFQEKKEVREGYIDTEGKLVIPTNYDYPNYSFQYGLARVVKNNKTGFIGKDGKIAIPLQFQEAGNFTDVITWFKSNGKYGFIDMNGKVIIEPIYDLVESFQEGLACVSQHGKFGYLNEKGLLVISLHFQEANSFREGLAVVKQNEKFFFINRYGRRAIQNSFDFANSFSEGLARVRVGGKYGYINKKGEWIVKPELEQMYHDAFYFKEGRAVFMKGEITSSPFSSIYPNFPRWLTQASPS